MRTKKQKIKTDVKRIIDATIYTPDMPQPYQIGMKCMIDLLVKYIAQNYELIKPLQNETFNKGHSPIGPRYCRPCVANGFTICVR